MNLFDYLDTYMKIYTLIISFLFGSVMGSFLNCYASRICHNESIVKGRSHCDACNHVLGILDLIPIVSYLINKGKCRYCGCKLSIRYLISEIVGGLSFVFIVLKFGFSLKTIEYLILISCMLAVSFADMEDYLIPDRFIIVGIVNRVVFILIGNDIKSELLNSIIPALVIGGVMIILVLVMEKILRKDAMGGGDIKLLFMLCLYNSLSLDLLGLLFSCIIGIIFGLIDTKGEKGKLFPFGPSICLGFFLVFMFGSSIVNWYLSLF